MGASRTARRVTVAAALAAVASAPVSGTAQELSWTGGVAWYSGSYLFTERVHTIIVSNGLDLSLGEAGLVSLSVPVVIQNAPLVSTVGDGTLLPTGGPHHAAVARRRDGAPVVARPGTGAGGGGGPGEGQDPSDGTVVFDDAVRTRLADPFASGSLALYGGDRGVLRAVRATAGLKVPLTDLEDGVGTGRWDGSVGLSATGAAGTTLLVADVSWWWLGDLPELPLRDGPTGSLALLRPLSPDWSLLFSVSASRAPVATADAPVWAGVGVGWLGHDDRLLSLTVRVGLTEGAPGFGVAGGWSVGL